MRDMESAIKPFIAWAGIGAWLLAAASRPALADESGQKGGAPAASAVQTPISFEDASLAASRRELLEMAFSAATAIPADPHLKDRSRAQEAVVDACLDLDQPKRAWECIQQIEDWRRGAAYADLAFHLVSKRGDTKEYEQYLEKARTISENAEDWMRDRIRVKMARTHAWLGQSELAAELEAGVVEAETGKVDVVRSMRLDESGFDDRMKAVDDAVAKGSFDFTRNALDGCVQLFDRFYGDQARRKQAEEKIKSSWSGLPVSVRVALMMDLIKKSLAHDDQAKAQDLLHEAQVMADGFNWAPEFAVPLKARLGGLRCQAGEKDSGRSQIDEAASLFKSQRETILTTDRAATLVTIAESYQDVGDGAAAMKAYVQAFEEATANGNARPRALDVSAICRSMAVHAASPGTEFLIRIRQSIAGLGNPW